ncbi:helix-turn-helix protein [Kushneria sinocarnis]|uniref:Helix-turn-helix protein n=1 Tax=Kushneria sinocarnis TaxID=595502 RepID=A0A420WUJ1_9GAMM|nr:helix-turn-helix transcriptional regulator [Kushneria sinocarnis]RKQ97117.1 helix-turn-helix protein [Kushneria sinocarnis]
MRLSAEKKKIFAERLRQACIARYGREHGIASYLANDLEVSPQTAAKWLRGGVTPSADRWADIASALNVNAEWLIGASHHAPVSVSDRFDDEGLEIAKKAARITFPLVVRLKPDATREEVEDLVETAYQLLKGGESENTVSGEIAHKLI